MVTSEGKKDGCSSWLHLTFISLVTFSVFGFLDSYGVLLVFLVNHFKESNEKAAWVGSTAMFGCFFLYPFALQLRYKFGIRATVLFAGVLLLPSFILSPMVPTLNLFFLTFSVPFSVAGSIIACATFTTILEHFDKYKGVAFGVRLGSNALGTVLYSIILPVLLTEIGWKRTFWILIGICFITICYALLHNDTPSTSDCSRCNSDEEGLPKILTKDDIRTYYRLLRNKECIVFLVANTIFSSVVFMPPVFMVQFATNLGHHVSKSKWLMIIRGITAVVVRYSAGCLGDIASRRKKMRFIALSVIILFSFSTILCTLTTSFSMLMLYMAFVSVVDSIHWVMLPLLVSEITKDVHSDKAVALFNCIGSFATLGGPPALGWLYDRTGDFRHVLYSSSAVSAVAACSIILWLCLTANRSPSLDIIEELINENNCEWTDGGLDATFVNMEDYIDPKQKIQYITVL